MAVRPRRRFDIGEHALPLALAALGAWLIAALVVRTLPGLFESRWRVTLLCLAMIAAAEVLLRLGGSVLGVDPTKRVAPAAWFGAMLIVFHAAAQLLWPGLYGSDESVVRNGSSWVMIAAVCPIIVARFHAERR